MVQVFHNLCLQHRRCSWSRPVIGAEADGGNSWTWAGEDNQPAKGSHEHSGCTRTQLYTRQCAEHNIKICTKEQPKLYKHHAPSLKTHCTGLWAQALKPSFNIANQEMETVSKIKEHQSSSSYGWEQTKRSGKGKMCQEIKYADDASRATN